MRQRRRSNLGLQQSSPFSDPCAGGLCVGMTNGPHQGGNTSYPVAWNGSAGTYVHSTMTVPEMPEKLDGITYYLWTDIFFGDASYGRMNQFVPQLLLGSVLDDSSEWPDYKPRWGTHDTWVFGAHYFFETWNPTTNQTNGHASYGKLHPVETGETLFTSFELVNNNQQEHGTQSDSQKGDSAPRWTLTMGVVGDDKRVSRLVVEQPYMGAWILPALARASYKLVRTFIQKRVHQCLLGNLWWQRCFTSTIQWSSLQFDYCPARSQQAASFVSIYNLGTGRGQWDLPILSSDRKPQ